jgi:Ca2+-binding EF-hand superfamily protein
MRRAASRRCSSGALAFRSTRLISSSRAAPLLFPGVTRLISTNARRNNRSWWWISTAIGAGFGASVGIALAEDNKKEEDKPADWRDRIVGNYRNRIREWSTPEKIFSTFASVKKDGEAFMTIEDFCDAILPFDYRHHEEKVKIKEIPEFIQLADIDKDQLISFPEYLFFTLLLGLPEEHFKIAFQMFDLDGNGSIDRNEFTKLIAVLQRESPVASKQRVGPPIEEAGIFQLFFGENGEKQLSFAEFENFLQQVQRGVLQLEFERYDPEGTGKISPKNFGMAIVGYAHPKDVPSYLDRVALLSDLEGSITFDEFINFHKALKKFQEIGLAVKLYSHGGSLDKKDFQRAVKTVAGVELTRLQVDTIFKIFDRNEDGQLDYQELMGIMEKRLDRGMSHHRDTGFTRFVSCLKDCCSRKAF